MFKNKRTGLLILVLAFAPFANFANADFSFGEPTNLGPAINGPGDEAGACLSPDGLEFYFLRMVGNIGEIWVTRRANHDSEWESATRLGPPLNTADNGSPFMTSDGLSLYFDGARPGGNGSWDLWVTIRATMDDNWGAPSNLGATINSASEDWAPSLSADGLELYFTSNRPGGHGKWDIWVTTRPTVDDNWGSPVNLGQTINTSAQENWPGISADGLLLFFGSSRSNGIGGWDLYMTRRATREDPWGPPMNVGPIVNSKPWQVGSRISADGSMLYFQSPRSGGFGQTDIWQAPIVPTVDLNGDGIVDAADVCIMIEHWHTDYPLCDIGPMPWGDGIVDVQDMMVLTEHLFEEVNLITHWKLDETEGFIANDSAGEKDGFLIGDPVWQPDAGMVDGALQFDGIDDCFSSDFVLNPSDGAFSVIAWIKSGEPGQVIVSQQTMANWLLVDSEGKLMTELKGTSRSASPLYSDTVITDGQWHRIGLVWDGSNRTIYVDGVDVAKDTQNGLESSEMGLYLGAGKGMESGTFFSGLIDDVRIYNQALSVEEVAVLAQ